MVNMGCDVLWLLYTQCTNTIHSSPDVQSNLRGVLHTAVYKARWQVRAARHA